tara:strand:+ start:131 stop:877 length:747 start_codon:yes stop_codon:yes gene_type:complete
MKNDFILVIPARLASTRLPRKLLREVEGVSIIQRTYNCALKAIGNPEKIIIATDSTIIKKHCDSFGANTLLTSTNCLTGTDRVAEVSNYIQSEQYINLQGDEPIFPSSELSYFIQEAIKDPSIVYTAVTKIISDKDYYNLSIPKMVFSKNDYLMYSSRAAIPSNKEGIFKSAFKHVCVYAFNKKHLDSFQSQSEKLPFELQEDLEINRYLELDIKVKCIHLSKAGKAVDTEQDLDIVRALLNDKNTIL